MSRVRLHVTLVRHTLSPEELVALSARLCYSRATVDDLSERISSCQVLARAKETCSHAQLAGA